MSHNLKAYIAKIEDLKPDSQYIKLPQGFCFVRNTDDVEFNKSYLFVSTDYFGGMGEQYSESQINKTLDKIFTTINDGLKFMGVVKGEYDEFDAFNLGNFRGYEDIELAFSVKYPDKTSKIKIPPVYSVTEIQNTMESYNKIKERVIFVLNMLKGFSYKIDHENNLIISPCEFTTENILFFDIKGSLVHVGIDINPFNDKLNTTEFGISFLESDDAMISKISLECADIVKQYTQNNNIKSVIDLTGFTEQFKIVL